MSDTPTTIIKRTTKARKTTGVSDTSPVSAVTLSKVKDDAFTSLVSAITETKEEFITLQKAIVQTREDFAREQHMHAQELITRNQQEDVARKREQEMYDYETKRVRKQTEDEFTEKKVQWERELANRKEEIAAEKKELELLRKQVAGFEEEKDKAVKDGAAGIQKELEEKFSIERQLREQEVKAEKELLNLRLTNLSQENTRQAQEIESLRKSLDEATRQLKEVAVKVIESGNTSQKSSTASES